MHNIKMYGGNYYASRKKINKANDDTKRLKLKKKK